MLIHCFLSLELLPSMRSVSSVVFHRRNQWWPLLLIVMLFFVFSSPDLIVQCYTFTDDYQSVNTAKVT